MESSIILTVYLPGAVGGMVRSVHKQKHKIIVSDPDTGEPTPKVATITHTDRRESDCRRVTNISGDIVSDWIYGPVPDEFKYTPRDWKKMSKKKKLLYYVNSYDEGYGVSYEIVNDGET